MELELEWVIAEQKISKTLQKDGKMVNDQQVLQLQESHPHDVIITQEAPKLFSLIILRNFKIEISQKFLRDFFIFGT